jgi:hypothetical protein
LPIRSQITFGGAPRRIASSARSAVFRYEDEVMRFREQPELRIVRPAEVEETRLSTVRKDIGQSRDELVRDVMVEK